MMAIRRDDGYELSTDPERLDIDRVHTWLSTDAYWALGRTRETTVRAIARSVVFGVYRPTDQAQVAFGRAVTDETTIAWLCDVYVDPAQRGRGLGSWLAATARDELIARGVRRIMLATVDAHEVYTRLGFTTPPRPDQLLELDLRG